MATGFRAGRFFLCLDDETLGAGASMWKWAHEVDSTGSPLHKRVRPLCVKMVSKSPLSQEAWTHNT